jgi:hypothetical protein
MLAGLPIRVGRVFRNRTAEFWSAGTRFPLENRLLPRLKGRQFKLRCHGSPWAGSIMNATEAAGWTYLSRG